MHFTDLGAGRSFGETAEEEVKGAGGIVFALEKRAYRIEIRKNSLI